ncbi:cobalamin-dependent protein [Saccharibacillus alkalitolerans]|uniref:Cobalamin-binding protein n=1 Tax=Saccharibacillus alkalitolerans TaxID=2705290 RepID=A0ABX0F5B6_9BACL|nr:cobalamin-dependent protein [Saccharibacillus alkalitolerans]NGZ75568.1 cobalamin-binding protein [Saccharibacillus alkalitolerans]
MTTWNDETLFSEIESLALDVTEEQYRIQPDLMDRYGRAGFEKSRRDTVYTLNYLAEGVLMDSPSLFLHYIGWLKQLLAGYGLTEADIRKKLELILDRVRAGRQGEMTERTIHILEMGIERTREPAEVPPFIAEDRLFGREARRYLDALLRSDRLGAYGVVDEMFERGETIRDIYRYVFQASQYEVGRLWQTQQISVADEHYCTAITQSAMSRLYAHWIGGERPKRGSVLVSACVGGEMHEIGLRMLTDVFELEGWDTYYMGANADEDRLAETVARRGADIVALSATMTFHVRLMKKLIARLRADERLTGVKIMVGGLPFNVDPFLWKRVGADGYAPDAEVALQEADRILKERTIVATPEEAGEHPEAEGGHQLGS